MIIKWCWRFTDNYVGMNNNDDDDDEKVSLTRKKKAKENFLFVTDNKLVDARHSETKIVNSINR